MVVVVAVVVVVFVVVVVMATAVVVAVGGGPDIIIDARSMCGCGLIHDVSFADKRSISGTFGGVRLRSVTARERGGELLYTCTCACRYTYTLWRYIYICIYIHIYRYTSICYKGPWTDAASLIE